MCTCVSYFSNKHYFGRNLDLEYSYCESVTIMPRAYPFPLKHGSKLEQHFAMIGIATVVDDYPLYYDAVNEHGLCAAGLNFPGNTVYHTPQRNANNIASYEFIPWILAQCKNLDDVKVYLNDLCITNDAFSKDFLPTPLHWMISDQTGSIVVESTKTEIKVHDNPVGILTNNPPFEFHMQNLCQYINLTREKPKNRMTNKLELKPFSNGFGALGLPGDLSSASRFIRAAFTKLNAEDDGTEFSAVNQFFHILGSVEQQRGCVRVGNGFEKTVYSTCCNANEGIYYYKTYDNSHIHAVRLHSEEINSKYLSVFPLAWKPEIYYEN